MPAVARRTCMGYFREGRRREGGCSAELRPLPAAQPHADHHKRWLSVAGHAMQIVDRIVQVLYAPQCGTSGGTCLPGILVLSTAARIFA
eukprot:3845698-Lingulodinium_polyedra.AAC.1